jgi:nicotinamidase-related amidase
MGQLIAPPGPHAAHLCIDMQRLFEPGSPWATPWMERVTPQVAALAQHAPARTVFTRFIPPRTKHDVRGIWRAYYEKWEYVTREKLDPALLELVPPSRVTHRRPGSSTVRFTVPSAMASCEDILISTKSTR